MDLGLRCVVHSKFAPIYNGYMSLVSSLPKTFRECQTRVRHTDRHVGFPLLLWSLSFANQFVSLRCALAYDFCACVCVLLLWLL